MASSADFVNYICEQLEGMGTVRSRKMFGEYMVYLNDRPVMIICGDRPMVKMLPCLAELLEGRPTEPPYEGAKDHYLLDPDDRETLREAVRRAEEATPLPKKKAPKKESAPADGPLPWDAVWPQQMKPALSDIADWVKNPLLEQLMDWIQETYQTEPSVEFSKCSMDRGWNIKYKKGSRALCVLYIRAGWVTAMVTLNAGQTEELEALLPTFSEGFRKLYQDTPRMKGGKWLSVDVKQETQLEEVRRLILIKAAPVKKEA